MYRAGQALPLSSHARMYRWRNWGTHRGRGGSRQQRQNASAGHDEVVHHLGDEVDAVVDKHDVLAAVHKVQNGLCGVAAWKKTNPNLIYMAKI